MAHPSATSSTTAVGSVSTASRVRRAAGAAVAVALVGVAFISLRSGLFAQPVRAEVDSQGVTAGAEADGIIDVPAEAVSLEAALNAASEGITIRLAPGRYQGSVTIGERSIRVVGAGASRTLIRGTRPGAVLQIKGGLQTLVNIEDLTVSGGLGETGAGLLVTSGHADIRGVTFRANDGSGAITQAQAKATFTDCTFQDNRNGFAGGALCNIGGAVLMVNCTCEGNRARTFGGAVYSQGGSVETIACFFTENSTTSGAYGGAVYGSGASLKVASTTFARNESREAGGAVYVQGGDALIDRCNFSGNLAEDAWAVYSKNAGVRVAGSTLCGNEQRLLGGDLKQGAGNAFDAACFPDCNQNGVSDADEVARGWARDADGNGIPDECDLDCNQNGMPDAYEIARGFAQDANGNGVIDTCEIRMGFVQDADYDLIPDAVTARSGEAPASADSDPPAASTADTDLRKRAPSSAELPRRMDLMRRR